MEIWMKERNGKHVGWKKTYIGTLPLYEGITCFGNLVEVVTKHSRESDEMHWIVFSPKEEARLAEMAKLSGFAQFHGTVNFINEGLKEEFGGNLPPQTYVTYITENAQGPPNKLRIAIEFNRK